MAELADILEDEFIPRQSAIHDLHDTGGVRTLTTTLAKYTNDGLVRNWSTDVLWDTTNSIIDCSTLPVGSKLDITLTQDVASGNQGAIVVIDVICPNNGSPFTLTSISEEIDRAVAYTMQLHWNGYVGDEVKLYGIELYGYLVTGSLDTTNQKLLLRA